MQGVLVETSLPTNQGTGIVGKARSWQRAESQNDRIPSDPGEQLCSPVAGEYSTWIKTMNPGNQINQLMVMAIGIVPQPTG
jgi:hypothetical protein